MIAIPSSGLGDQKRSARPGNSATQIVNTHARKSCFLYSERLGTQKRALVVNANWLQDTPGQRGNATWDRGR